MNSSIGKLLQVEIIALEAMRETPYVVIKQGNAQLFQFALDNGFLDLDKKLVLDPLFVDFTSKRIDQALRAVGGKAAPIKRARKRR
ncbi:MAG TPA: hypothetical protein PLZ07_08705 [Syntrophales bacterium]|nr:hypothetical protein [Syntrophales bacterium]